MGQCRRSSLPSSMRKVAWPSQVSLMPFRVIKTRSQVSGLRFRKIKINSCKSVFYRRRRTHRKRSEIGISIRLDLVYKMVLGLNSKCLLSRDQIAKRVTRSPNQITPISEGQSPLFSRRRSKGRGDFPQCDLARQVPLDATFDFIGVRVTGTAYSHRRSRWPCGMGLAGGSARNQGMSTSP